MQLARLPNLRVLSVYSIFRILELMHRIIAVFELPPKEFFKIFVKGEFLYGMNLSCCDLAIMLMI